jgi:hypothetical protein
MRYEQAAGVLSFKRDVDQMSTAVDSSSFASDLASKKSDQVRFWLSIAVVALGIATAVWALAAVHHGFSPDELGLMAALT